jgi:DNA-binding SARP family transcriptional activator
MLEFRVLGPVEAAVDGRLVPLAAAKPRALLAVLLLHRNRAVAAGELVDELWGEMPPDTATKALQGYVSQLRKALGADRIETLAAGYVLRDGEGELDLDRFEHLAAEGHELLASGAADAAAGRLGEALALWRGTPFAEFGAEPFARDARARLEGARLGALEDRIDADLRLGRAAALVPELELLAAGEPFRERVTGLLMLALYRSGRQADALEVYRRTRARLVEELGIEPGEELQELHRAMLRHDDSLRGPRPSAVASPAGAGEQRQSTWPRVVALVAVVALAAAAAALILTRGSSGSDDATAPAIRPFVHKLELFLDQSRTGREQVAATVFAASHCKLPRRQAVGRLDVVERNRQSLLQAVAALNVPDRDDALRASDLLQQAIQASITADQYWRNWLAHRTSCVLGAHPDLEDARSADADASRAKERFVVAFNPLARGLGLREWRADEL